MPAPKEYWYKPGQSGNPGGKPSLPIEVREMQAHTRAAAARYIVDYAALPLDEIKRRLTAKETPMLERVIAAIYSKAAQGSMPHANALLERILGPVPKAVIIDNTQENPAANDTKAYGPEVLTRIMFKLRKEAEELECSLSQERQVVSLEQSQGSSPQSSPQALDSELSKQRLND